MTDSPSNLRGMAVYALGAAVFLGALDQTVVVTALPAIVQDLQVPFGRLNDAAWIVNAYLLGYTVAMPLVGRMSDVFGRQRVLLGCLALFGLSSVWCGAAHSLESLIVARGLQAVGGGALLPVALGAVGTSTFLRARTVSLGIVAAVAEAGGVLGPLWGALILDRADWPWVFWVNVPLVIVIAALLRFGAATDWETARSDARVDYVGAALLGGGLGALALGLSRESSQGLEVRLGLGLVALVLLSAFVVCERRVVDPLVEVGLFKVRAFAAANALSLLSGVALIVAMVDIPLYSATLLQRSAVDGGLLLMRLMAAIPVGAVAGGLLTRRLGPAPTAAAGVIACVLALAALAGWRPDTADAVLTGELALGGVGFGLQLAPISSTAIGVAGPARAGVAAALATVMRMIGMLVGLSSLTSWGLERFNALVAGLPLPLPVPGDSAEATARRLADFQQAVQDAGLVVFHDIFLAAAVISLVALGPAFLLRMPARAVR